MYLCSAVTKNVVFIRYNEALRSNTLQVNREFRLVTLAFRSYNYFVGLICGGQVCKKDMVRIVLRKIVNTTPQRY